jgi:catechol 2,3-dioxygenase-like lactoylglutathione lyase family enzyme
MSPSSPLATIKALDHLVMTVTSIERTVAFYTQLGMRHEQFSPPSAPETKRHTLLFGASKINLHELGREFVPHAAAPTPGSADLCFLVEEDVELVRSRLGLAGVDVLEGDEVVRRTGAGGPLRSIYVRDPDGNLIECVPFLWAGSPGRSTR